MWSFESGVWSYLDIPFGIVVGADGNPPDLTGRSPSPPTVKTPPPEFWADVEETRRAVENGTAEVYSNMDEFMKAINKL